VEAMIKAHDIKGDNRIDFEEFKLIFFDKDPKANRDPFLLEIPQN